MLQDSYNMSLGKFIVAIIIYFLIKHSSCQTHDQVENLRQTVLKNYSRSLRPIMFQNQSMDVYIRITIGQVTSFDAVNGVLTTMALFYVTWKDDFLTWDPSKYGNTSYLPLSVKVVWIPNVVLLNGEESYNFLDVDVEGFQVFVTPTGNVSMIYVGYVKTMCTPNVKYFPFDNNQCAIMFGIFGYYQSHVIRLISLSHEDASVLYANPQWHVEENHPTNKQLNHMAYVEKIIKLRRRPIFLIVNLFIPMIFLVVMNFFVFVLPVDSGEKASYSMTILLSFTVFVTAIVNELPQVSTDLPIVSYIILLQLFINMFVCVFTLFSIHYYHKPDGLPVGRCHRTIVKIMKRFGKKVVKVHSQNDVNKAKGNTEDSSDDCEQNGQEDDLPCTYSWKHVSESVDRLMLLMLIIFSVVEVAMMFYIAL